MSSGPFGSFRVGLANRSSGDNRGHRTPYLGNLPQHLTIAQSPLQSPNPSLKVPTAAVLKNCQLNVPWTTRQSQAPELETGHRSRTVFSMTDNGRHAQTCILTSDAHSKPQNPNTPKLKSRHQVVLHGDGTLNDALHLAPYEACILASGFPVLSFGAEVENSQHEMTQSPEL